MPNENASDVAWQHARSARTLIAEAEAEAEAASMSGQLPLGWTYDPDKHELAEDGRTVLDSGWRDPDDNAPDAPTLDLIRRASTLGNPGAPLLPNVPPVDAAWKLDRARAHAAAAQAWAVVAALPEAVPARPER